MNNSDFCIKVKNLNLIANLDQKISNIFVKINLRNQQIIQSNDEIYFSSHNKKVIDYIYQELLENFKSKIDIEIVNDFSELNQLGTIIFPLPENKSIYDVVSISGKNNIENRSQINIKDYNNFNIINPVICKCCYKQTPKEINFCISCGFILTKDELIEDFQIKISKIDTETKIKAAKYLSEISNLNYSNILNSLGILPIVIKLKAYATSINHVLNQLDKYNISHELIDNKTFNANRIISGLYPSIDLGKINFEYEYINKSISKIVVDTMKNLVYDQHKKLLSSALYESYQIIDNIRNSDDSSRLLMTDIEKEINKLLEKYIFLIKRSDKLKIFLSEINIDKLNREIKDLENKISVTNNISLKKINSDVLELKNKEMEEIIKLIENDQITEAQVNSVSSLLSSIKTKVNYLGTYDIQENKGNYAEINSIRNNLILKIKAIDETLRI